MDELIDIQAWEARGVHLLVERCHPASVTLRRCAAGTLRVYMNTVDGEAIEAYDVVLTSDGRVGANIVSMVGS